MRPSDRRHDRETDAGEPDRRARMRNPRRESSPRGIHHSPSAPQEVQRYVVEVAWLRNEPIAQIAVDLATCESCLTNRVHQAGVPGVPVTFVMAGVLPGGRPAGIPMPDRRAPAAELRSSPGAREGSPQREGAVRCRRRRAGTHSGRFAPLVRSKSLSDQVDMGNQPSTRRRVSSCSVVEAALPGCGHISCHPIDLESLPWSVAPLQVVDGLLRPFETKVVVQVVEFHRWISTQSFVGAHVPFGMA